MSDQSPEDAGDEELEACLDDIDEFIGTLQRYPDTVIAMSLRIHLAALLHAMIDNGSCTREDVREFVVALEQEALSVGDT
jgi:hypothetical protein